LVVGGGQIVGQSGMAEAQTALVKCVFLDVTAFTKECSVVTQADVVEKLNQLS
jgi:hypothetical protein